VSGNAELSPVKRALLEIRQLRSRLATLEAERDEAIAIVGLSIRAPGGVDDAESFERLLWSATDAISEIPASRWPLEEWYAEAQDAPGKMYTRFGGFIDHVDEFDAEFFGIAPVEAASMDPQQRLVLELAWHALENAGHAPSALSGTPTGVYLGISNSDYGRALFAHPELIDPYFSPGTALSVAAGRVSYVLGLQGPAVSVDTACSSSLVALHLACQGLRLGECNLALAGGVNLMLTPEVNVNFSKAGMMSRDGRCRTFDAQAAGYVRGEGGALVVLRRLRDALADGDRVLAVVRGSAVNQDGRSNGLTAPNGPAQEAVIRRALAQAGVHGAQVGYVEAHGTGTSLGDPIEVNALSAVMSEGRDADTPLVIGSVKTNIGHLEAAAGIAGVVKTVIALGRRELPPNLHFETPNPLIDWAAMPMTIPTDVMPWEPIGGRRLAGVSSFGFSGTNAHVILESAPDPVPLAVPPAAPPARTLAVLVLSARDATALRVLAAEYVTRLNALDAAALADFCFTASTGRAPLQHRLSVSGPSPAALASALEAWLQGRPHPRVIAGVAGDEAPRVAYLFPGQGPQYAGMGRELYGSSPVFREAFDACADVLDTLLPRPIRPIVFPADGDATPLDETAYAQPAMFAIEYALATLWKSWGVVPVAVMGHSFGEYAAACVAGVVSLADAAAMVVARGRLVAALPGDGLMTVVEASDEELLDAIRVQGGPVAIAAVNGPTNCVISGERRDVTAIAERFAAMGRRVKALRVSHAFHSPLMDPVLDDFERALASVRYALPTTSLISNLTGEIADLATVGRASYWRDHLRHPVRFAQSVQVLSALRVSHFIEMSPHPVLLGMAAECVTGGVWLPSLREDQGAWSEMLLTLQRLFVDGAAIDWQAVAGAGVHRRLALPAYPFQRKRHWVDAVGTPPVREATSAADAWSAMAPVLAAQSHRGPLDLDATSYTAKWDCLARLTRAVVLDTLQGLGVFTRAGESHTIDSLLGITRVLPAHRQLLSRWLAHLVQDDTLRQAGDRFVATDGRAPAPLADLWEEAERCFRDNREMLAYVRNCATRLAAIVTGRESALESLFPNGSFDLATALYEQSATMRYINSLAAAGLEAVVRSVPIGRVLRVLEIGAGTGGTTSSLLRVLPPDRSEYLFTDVSDVFLDRARERFSAYPQLRFGRFDLELGLAEQGFAPGQFDVIVSANCVHASSDLRAVLSRLRELLAPNGVLMLVESTVHFEFFDITTGLIEGWQAFADDLRTDNPLLPPDRWTGALLDAGFATAAAWPERGSVAETLGQHVVVAHVSPSVQRARSARATPRLEGGSAGTAPVAPDAVAFRAQLDAALPGERHALLCDAVRGEVMRILRLDADSSPALHDRLMHLGMDSLMAVQLRNALVTLLGLERSLPATLIFDYPTIAAISEYLLASVNLRAAPSVGAPGPASAPAAARAAEAVPLEASTIAGMSDDEIEATLMAREDWT
jgi:acyl transferase domain-containing protein/trans-aconitate methyltransferase